MRDSRQTVVRELLEKGCRYAAESGVAYWVSNDEEGMTYKFVTREDLIKFVQLIESLDDRDQLERRLDRLLAERDAYREVAYKHSQDDRTTPRDKEMAFEIVDAEAARLMDVTETRK